MYVFNLYPIVSGDPVKKRYTGDTGVSILPDPLILLVTLVRRTSLPALTGHYLRLSLCTA